MIEVTIGGCESSYFAGEQIELTLTFTNTNTRPSSSNSTAPVSPNPPRSAASHRRGTHSISSAPLPRPATSPGVHQSFHTHHRPSLSASSDPPRTRRGLIGFSSAPLHSLHHVPQNTPFNAAVSRAKRLAGSRSLSVNLLPSQLEDNPSSNSRTPSPSTPDDFPPRSPSILQTPARERVISSEMPLPAGHPHTRKQSVQLNIQQPSESLSLAPIADLHSSPIPLTPLAPSPLSQSIVYNPSTPSPPPPPSPSQTLEQQSRSNSAPPPRLGLGIELSSPPRPSVSRSLSDGPRSPSNFNPPGYETLLWAYAQLSGTVELDPAFSRPEAVRHLTAKLAKRPVGGGSLDLKESMYNPVAASPLGGLGALLGFGSPSPVGSPAPGTPGRGGFLSSMFSPRPTPARLDVASGGAVPSGSLTTFEPPQSLLAVDLALAPGESKSYTYRVTLPSELPPTFRGRALRFSYHVVVGTCKGGPHMENQTRLLKVPLRVYNHIPVGRPPPVYDLLWPSRVRTSLLKSAEVEEIGTPPSTDPTRLNGHKNSGESRSGQTNAELTALQQFGRSLRDTKQGFEDQRVEEQSEGALRGCRTAIEIMTRQPSKASYDVNKGGHPVAILTLPKTIFRLGESVHGTIEINCFDSVPISVLKVCVLLEAHESLPARLRTTSKGLLALRKVHGEHHDSQTAHTRRTTFALDIPSDGVPAFRVANESGDREQLGGLEWRLRICFLVSENGLPMVKESGAGEWGKTWAASDAINEGAVETVECEVGIVVLPSHTLFASVPLKFGV